MPNLRHTYDQLREDVGAAARHAEAANADFEDARARYEDARAHYEQARAHYEQAKSEQAEVERKLAETAAAIDRLLDIAGVEVEPSSTTPIEEPGAASEADDTEAPPPVPVEKTAPATAQVSPTTLRPSFKELVVVIPRDGDVGRDELQAAFPNLTEGAVNSRVAKAKNAGVIESGGWGRYRLTEAGKLARDQYDRRLRLVTEEE